MRLASAVFAAVLFTVSFIVGPAIAAEPDYVPDDIVYIDLATEGFVTTKTANVSITVDAAGNDEKTATLRTEMQKAVEDLTKAEWRLTSFNRSQDQSGLTRWQAFYEARLSESALAGLNDRAQKLSKPGMQLRINNIDFTPTLAETEARRAELRNELYKRAAEEQKRLNDTLPGRGYRIGSISFGGAGQPVPLPQPMMMKAMRAEAMDAGAGFAAASAPSAEVSQNITVTARVAFAATRPAAK